MIRLLDELVRAVEIAMNRRLAKTSPTVPLICSIFHTPDFHDHISKDVEEIAQARRSNDALELR